MSDSSSSSCLEEDHVWLEDRQKLVYDVLVLTFTSLLLVFAMRKAKDAFVATVRIPVPSFFFGFISISIDMTDERTNK